MSDTGPKSIPPIDGGGKAPAKIGRYEILEKVGSGRTGTVYRASDPLIGRILAIKTFRVDLTPGPLRDRFLQRFYHEARISGGLAHPNIVALFDVGEEDGLPYLVFEHVEGPTLDVTIAKAGRLDSTETIRVVEQAAAALDFAHAKGIVHRDIRPANIILANDKRVRIADFGIARVEGSQLTQHGEVLGTPAYMSPEQIRGQELSAESDLFSLAVCAYEMLSGSRPFAGKTQPELLEALVYSPPTEPKELRTLGIPSRDFMFVFERALAKDPSHRFADASSFARALKSCLGVVAPGDEPVPVSRIAVPEAAPALRRSILPPVAPPPVQRYASARTSTSRSGAEAPSVPSAPAADASADATFITPQAPTPSSDASADATFITPNLPSAPPVSDPSADATFVSPPPSNGAPPSEPSPFDDEVSPTLGFDQGLNAKKLNMPTAEATMISPQDLELPPTHRMSRAAVESVLSKSAPAQTPPATVLQKTLPGSEKSPVQSVGPLDGLLPPTREMPKLPENAISTPPLSARQDPSTTASTPGSRSADKTIIMTEAEKAAAAKLRDRSVAKLQTTAQRAALPPPLPPAPTKTMLQPRPQISAPPVRPLPAAPRPSMLPKILIAASVLLALMAILLAALFWTKTAGTAAQTAETWNDLPVYPEAAVDKSPLLFSHESPKFNVERAVSVTVSWIVTPEGVVDDPKIVTSGTKEIDAYVMESVKKWRYEPGQKGGKTVPVRVLRKYTFKPVSGVESK